MPKHPFYGGEGEENDELAEDRKARLGRPAAWVGDLRLASVNLVEMFGLFTLEARRLEDQLTRLAQRIESLNKERGRIMEELRCRGLRDS